MNKSVSNSEGISSNKTIDSPETPKKQESVSIISDTRKLLEHYYMENQIGFYEKAWRYLKGGWESNRKNFN